MNFTTLVTPSPIRQIQAGILALSAMPIMLGMSIVLPLQMLQPVETTRSRCDPLTRRMRLLFGHTVLALLWYPLLTGAAIALMRLPRAEAIYLAPDWGTLAVALIAWALGLLDFLRMGPSSTWRMSFAWGVGAAWFWRRRGDGVREANSWEIFQSSMPNSDLLEPTAWSIAGRQEILRRIVVQTQERPQQALTRAEHEYLLWYLRDPQTPLTGDTWCQAIHTSDAQVRQAAALAADRAA